jgi:SIR2-like protein
MTVVQNLIHKDDRKDFDDLTAWVLAKKCTPFIGAGLSAERYPKWCKLVKDLCIACSVTPPPDDCTDGQKLMQYAQDAKDAGEKTYYEILLTIFQEQQPTYNHGLLVSLRFPLYLTVNFDLLLEQAMCDSPKDGNHKSENSVGFIAYPAIHPSMPTDGTGDIVYLHGRIKPPKDAPVPQLVLTTKEYAKAYPDSRMANFLASYIINHTMLFLGCSCDDHRLFNLYKIIYKQHCDAVDDGETLSNVWYALISDKDENPEKWSGYGIHAIRYDKINKDYLGLWKILSEWNKPNRASIVQRHLESDRLDLNEPKREPPHE